VAKRDSCSPHSIYPSNVLPEEFRQSLEEFLDILWKVNPHRKLYRKLYSRGNFTYFIGRKFVLIYACHSTWRVSQETGNLHHWKRKSGPYGNMFDIVERYKKGAKIRWDGDMSITVEGAECGVCGRTEFVAKTVNGLLCRHCRGSLSRHVNLVRQLGGVPRVYGRPIKDIYDVK